MPPPPPPPPPPRQKRLPPPSSASPPTSTAPPPPPAAAPPPPAAAPPPPTSTAPPPPPAAAPPPPTSTAPPPPPAAAPPPPAAAPPPPTSKAPPPPPVAAPPPPAAAPPPPTSKAPPPPPAAAPPPPTSTAPPPPPAAAPPPPAAAPPPPSSTAPPPPPVSTAPPPPPAAAALPPTVAPDGANAPSPARSVATVAVQVSLPPENAQVAVRASGTGGVESTGSSPHLLRCSDAESSGGGSGGTMRSALSIAERLYRQHVLSPEEYHRAVSVLQSVDDASSRNGHHSRRRDDLRAMLLAIDASHTHAKNRNFGSDGDDAPQQRMPLEQQALSIAQESWDLFYFAILRAVSVAVRCDLHNVLTGDWRTATLEQLGDCGGARLSARGVNARDGKLAWALAWRHAVDLDDALWAGFERRCSKEWIASSRLVDTNKCTPWGMGQHGMVLLQKVDALWSLCPTSEGVSVGPEAMGAQQVFLDWHHRKRHQQSNDPASNHHRIAVWNELRGQFAKFRVLLLGRIAKGLPPPLFSELHQT